MSTKAQIGIAAIAVVFAGGLALLFSGRPEPAMMESGSGGHDHAAMTALDPKGPRPVQLDPTGARRIGVTYATVERKPLDREVHTVATVTYDETRLANVNAKIEGWVETLYVDFTGAPVRRGQPLLDLYSPQLVSAQEELILARRLVDETASDPGGRAAERARQLLEAARRRLAYWDIPENQIAAVEEGGEPRKTLTLSSPADGIVVEKNVVEGSRVTPGMDLYKVADLSRVWVEGEVFEKDLSLVREGQTARVLLEAYPGEALTGTVTYVYPTVSLEARTGRIRVELENPDLTLKPGMYAHIELDTPTAETAAVVPRSAVHVTGERSYVFVAGPDGVLVARQVVTGLVAGSEIEILSGLINGERVVSSANFLIDAESSMGAAIAAMPGMEMEPASGGEE